ncbi:hypothetical protein TcWFU_009242 [Taenia crassiceps]|uniref:Uncharacterized protein n=1 Tax=Taenia crassiceps TaxID=6207 RepID=A0ABR4Q1F5_9CEST
MKVGEAWQPNRQLSKALRFSSPVVIADLVLMNVCQRGMKDDLGALDAVQSEDELRMLATYAKSPIETADVGSWSVFVVVRLDKPSPSTGEDSSDAWSPAVETMQHYCSLERWWEVKSDVEVEGKEAKKKVEGKTDAIVYGQPYMLQTMSRHRAV